MKKTHDLLNIAKFIAAILVISIHVPPFSEGNPALHLLLLGVVSRLAVPLFFISSGYFFMKSYEKSIHRSILHKTIKLYLVWTIIYFPLKWLTEYRSISPGEGLLLYVQEWFVHEPYYHLWYLNALLFSLWMLSWLKNKKISINILLLIGLTLYVIGVLGNTYKPFIETNVLWDVYFSLFKTTRNGLFMGFPFVVVGAYIYEQEEHVVFKKRYFIISLFLLLIEPAILYALQTPTLWDFYFTIFPVSFLLFLFLIQSKTTLGYQTYMLRKMSSWIYFIHPGVNQFFLELFYLMDIKAPIMIRFIAVTLVSVFLSYYAVRLSDSKFLKRCLKQSKKKQDY